MPVQNLKAQIAHLPEQPGVYLFANEAGETIYIGKARSLRDRVRSYLGAHGLHPKTDALLDEADRLEVIITDSVVEALALENNLVKERAPRYNVRLRDDKNYPYLQLTTNEDFPRVLVARRVERDGTFYAGPFMPASLARKTMGLTHRLFGIRSCNEVITGMRDRPCLEYDIKRCIAPCVMAICSKEQYDEAVQRTRLFFEGKNEELIDRLTTSMTEAAEGERFEEAAHLRDATRTVQTLRDRQQKIATARLGDRDAFGIHMGPAGAVVHVFVMREGKVPERFPPPIRRYLRWRRKSFRRRWNSFTRAVRRRPRCICRAHPRMASCWRRGSQIGQAERFRSWYPSEARSAAWSTWLCATLGWRIRRG